MWQSRFPHPLAQAPLIGMQLTNEVNWSPGDFLFAALMLGLVGTTLELVVRTRAQWSYRIAAIIAVGTCFVTVWGNLAGGLVGSEDNLANLYFFVPPIVAILASALARFRARGMTFAMAIAAGTQLIAGFVVGSGGDTIEVWVVTGVFTLAWLVAAYLFSMADDG